mmetsp:Transcript_22850/g.51760  ORF Transcript_22850/g.51760 Transcript_22850/m.51760 type:complete len:256 (+) Transcript_22850:751-1518(+)
MLLWWMVKSVVAGRGWLVGAHRVRLCTELSDHLDLIATTWPIWTEIDVVVEVAQVPREIRVVGEDTDGVVMDVDLTAENFYHHVLLVGVIDSPMQQLAAWYRHLSSENMQTREQVTKLADRINVAEKPCSQIRKANVSGIWKVLVRLHVHALAQGVRANGKPRLIEAVYSDSGLAPYRRRACCVYAQEAELCCPGCGSHPTHCRHVLPEWFTAPMHHNFPRYPGIWVTTELQATKGNLVARSAELHRPADDGSAG